MVKKSRRAIRALEPTIVAQLPRDAPLENRYRLFGLDYKFSTLTFKITS